MAGIEDPLQISARRFILGVLGGAAAALALYLLFTFPTGIASPSRIPVDPGVAKRLPGSDSGPVSGPGADSGSFLVEIVAPAVVAFVVCAALWEARAFIRRPTHLHASRVEPEGLSVVEAEELVKSLSTVLSTSELSPSERLELVKARVQQAHAAPVEADEPRLPYWVTFGSPVVGMATGVAGVVIALAQ
jgi:hypothetical protein